jgi:hypothetical protein
VEAVSTKKRKPKKPSAERVYQKRASNCMLQAMSAAAPFDVVIVVVQSADGTVLGCAGNCGTERAIKALRAVEGVL